MGDTISQDAKLNEAERKAMPLSQLSGSMMLACKELAGLQKSHAYAPMIPYEKGCACPMCDIALPDFSDEAIKKLVEESNAAYAKLQEMREALKRAEWDFEALISRGDLADEPRAHETLRILSAALAQHHSEGEKQ